MAHSLYQCNKGFFMKLRTQKGSTAALAFIALVPLLAALGGFAVDCMHVNDAHGELQRATDAAALAGAQSLGDYKGTGSTTASSVSASNEQPVNYALQVSSLNAVDGPSGLWAGGNRTVTATIVYDPNFSGPPNRPNRCNVTGQIGIKSFFAHIFGNVGQTVNTTSSAALTPLSTLYSFMPLLVSLNDFDPSGRKLEDQDVGDEYTVEIKSNTSSNSVWILNSNKDCIAQLDHIADPANYPAVEMPPLSVGDWVKSDNGKKSAGKQFQQLVGKDVAFVITGDAVDSDYLAKGQPLHQIVGFMVMHVTSADSSAGKDGYSLTGLLKPAVLNGTYNQNVPASQITTFSPFLARLVQ